MSGKTNQTITEEFNYTISNDNLISICTTSSFCNEYRLENGELVNSLNVVGNGNPLFDCFRTLTYRK